MSDDPHKYSLPPNGTDVACTRRCYYRIFRSHKMIERTKDPESHPSSSCPSLSDTGCGSGLGIPGCAHIGVVTVQFSNCQLQPQVSFIGS